MAKKSILPVVLVGIAFFITVPAKVDFTNIKCVTYNKSVVYFDKCLLKAVNRTYKYITISAKLPLKIPSYDIKTNFAMLRKENGYKPFLYNMTFNGCEYLRKRNNPVINFAHKFFEKYSTVNRTCPYGQQDERVEKLPISHINNLVTNVLPSPHGEYAYVVSFYFYTTKTVSVTVYGSLS